MRRTVVLLPVLVNGYHSPATGSDPATAQLRALDDIFARYPVLTLVHILPGLFFVLLGPLQFSRTFGSRHWQWHRCIGRVFMVSGLIIGLSALVMSFAMPAIGGINQATCTILFSGFFLLALGKAFWHIRRGQVALHREWMIRAFSIGLAVATIRPIIGIFFATSRFSGLRAHEFFGTGFWIGFVLHLVATEVWIHRTRPQPATPSRGKVLLNNEP